MRAGPDPDFPYLTEQDHYFFRDPKEWDDNIIAVGGNLSPGMLLSAYEQGIFPWYNPEDPILWQSPDPRCVIFPDKLHVSASMRKILKNGVYEIKFDENFESTMNGCALTKRRGQDGTWISRDIISAYTELHRLGWAHCAEAWQDGELAGGCYGVLMGRAFFGESMFSGKPNASKAAFLSLAEVLFEHGVAFVDCQVPTPHLLSLGGEVMPRKEFLALLNLFKVSR
ncbi:MAG: leucyl/phenylalanyl-tRNA--protein transferase [Treponema sp.]|jgi:leucyl/phenylalanyl-tRNA--protein transferase|nr:leucyl/phenylalanyl-tRNA--protein transferase [Treponema sp.]